MFLFFGEFNLFSLVNFKFYFKCSTLQRMSSMIKHISYVGKVDPGDRVNLSMKLACKPKVSLSHLLG